jgi:hypothetical protein
MIAQVSENGSKADFFTPQYSVAGQWDIKLPILDQVRDTADLARIFKELPFAVPYASFGQHTAQRTLTLLFNLYEASETQKAVCNRKSEFAFGDFLDLQPRQKRGFRPDTPAEKPPGLDAKKFAFVDHLESLGLDMARVKECINIGRKHETACGLQWVRVTLANSEGQWRAGMSVVEPRHCVRLFDQEKPDSSLSNSVLISSHLEKGQVKKGNFEIVGIWPNFTERRGGDVLDAVFQMNVPGYENAFYGRPLANTLQVYADYLRLSGKVKISTTELVSTLALLMQKPKREADGYGAKSTEYNSAEVAKTIRQRMQADGDNPKSVFILDYPQGVEKPEIVKLEISRDAAYAKLIIEDCQSGISISEGIHPAIMGYSKVSGGIGTTLMLDLYSQCNEFTIMPLQNRYLEFWDYIFEFIFTNTGRGDLSEALSLKFPNKLQKLIDNLKGANEKGNSETATDIRTSEEV